MQITANFSYYELECPCCEQLEIDYRFIQALQEIRDAIGRPIKITSGFRCHKHNMEVGGAITSNHLKGRAVDISTRGWSSEDLHYLVYELTSKQHPDFQTGVGIYKNHIHFDFRESDDSLWVNL